MQKEKSIVPILDDLFNDDRLARLFSKDARHCALQLWILQIKSDQSIENRVVYGRLLPYSHSSNRWSASNDDNFHSFGQVQAQIIRLNLYIESTYCVALLRLLSLGQTISAISEELKLDFPDQLKARFGTTALAAENLAYRPVAYLLNRDAYDQRSLSSPHGGAGAISASITRTDKEALFRFGQDYNAALTESVVEFLNEDTGLDFGSVDVTRFGDIELLVFPALNDEGQSLLSVNWTDIPCTLVARFNPMQVPQFSGFQFHLSITNNGQIIYSGIATAKCNAEGEFECKFGLSDQLRARTDSTKLEIFGFRGRDSREGTLCCLWLVGYIPEVNFQIHAMGQKASPVKFDWLEKTTTPAASTRVKAALTISRGNQRFTNHIGKREADPWVPANRDLTSLFARLHPLRSEGQFFLRWSQDNEGRLQFVEWFKALLAKYQQHQIVIFDPYFEDAGLGLMLLCAAQNANYIVFRSLPKLPSKEYETKSNEFPSGIDNLMTNCKQNRHLLERINLRIYGLKDGRLHDRYILITESGRLPVAGFNLSNSFQATAQNQPLLITPIPADVLLQVEQYKFGLVQEAEQSESETGNPAVQLLFNSMASPTEPRRYEPLRFLEKANAGDALSVWASEPSLRGLSGDPLKEKMVTLGLLKDEDNSLALPEMGLSNCLDQRAEDFADFTATWEVLGEILAHSHIEGNHYFQESDFKSGFLQFLEDFLNVSFNHTHDEANKELAVIDAQFFRKPIETLLHSSYRIYHLFHATKYTALTWSEYFTIKFLWSYTPDTLIAIIETQISSLPMERQGSDVVRLSLLSQIISTISLSIQFNISEIQRDCLIRSKNGLLQWIGLNAIEMQLEKPGGLAAVLQLIDTFAYPEQVRTLGWMIHHTAENPNKAEIYKGLIVALHKALPTTIPADGLKYLVDSMRGHMWQLAWVEPWLFRDVVFPLLKNNRANFDNACEIWIQELAQMLEPTLKNKSQLFNLEREGQTTNIAAFLFANSSPEQQRSSLESMKKILKRQQRIIQQPLASTSNWVRWNHALIVSMWILAFSKWSECYLRQCGATNPAELGQLSQNAQKLAMVRPMDEWHLEDPGRPGQLASFLGQAESFLTSINESK